MSKTYPIEEVSRLTGMSRHQVKQQIRSTPELMKKRVTLLEMNRFSSEDISLLLQENKTATVEQTVEVMATPPLQKEALIMKKVNDVTIEEFRNDMMKAIFAGGRTNENLIRALRNQLVTHLEDADQQQSLVVENGVSRLKSEISELRVKLDRQNVTLHKILDTQQKMDNRLKREANLQRARAKRHQLKHHVNEKPPLAWYERALFELFTPWKLRGRI